MKDLIEFIAKELVDHPESVRVSEVRGARATIYKLQ
ncbi:MAG: RNA-binding protein, partial [Chloroflexi bacterium]|nr:RNA-binding protein [Chloroflexota bacterium]